MWRSSDFPVRNRITFYVLCRLRALASLSLRRPAFYPGRRDVRCVLDKVGFGEVVLRVLLFPFVSTILPMLHTHLHLNTTHIIRTRGWSLRPFKQKIIRGALYRKVRVRSDFKVSNCLWVEGSSHPILMNNRIQSRGTNEVHFSFQTRSIAPRRAKTRINVTKFVRSIWSFTSFLITLYIDAVLLGNSASNLLHSTLAFYSSTTHIFIGHFLFSCPWSFLFQIEMGEAPRHERTKG
jgi:hypothetical protein